MTKRLHIVSFDNPYPPNYGGAIDVFYKIKALYDAGVEIILHSYSYGREPSATMESFCRAVYYYPRLKKIITGTPYIISSRSNAEVLANLCIDDSPILFEGLHTCYFLNHPQLAARKKLVRMHNIEHHYYAKLGKSTSNLFKKLYFNIEAKWIERFTSKLQAADYILAISPNDYDWLHNHFEQTIHIPPFHENETLQLHEKSKQYAFYHGNLGIAENNEAATFLIDHVFSKIDYPLIIAGSNPSKSLQKKVSAFKHITLHNQLNTAQINNHIATAHINIIPTFQDTGIKLKLLNVLYKGKFVIANSVMVDNTGCRDLCTVANTPEEMIAAINQLCHKKFDSEQLHDRRIVLNQLFNTKASAQKIIELL
jgi:hypothetical protein